MYHILYYISFVIHFALQGGSGPRGPLGPPGPNGTVGNNVSHYYHKHLLVLTFMPHYMIGYARRCGWNRTSRRCWGKWKWGMSLGIKSIYIWVPLIHQWLLPKCTLSNIAIVLVSIISIICLWKPNSHPLCDSFYCA